MITGYLGIVPSEELQQRQRQLYESYNAVYEQRYGQPVPHELAVKWWPQAFTIPNPRKET